MSCVSALPTVLYWRTFPLPGFTKTDQKQKHRQNLMWDYKLSKQSVQKVKIFWIQVFLFHQQTFSGLVQLTCTYSLELGKTYQYPANPYFHIQWVTYTCKLRTRICTKKFLPHQLVFAVPLEGTVVAGFPIGSIARILGRLPVLSLPR